MNDATSCTSCPILAHAFGVEESDRLADVGPKRKTRINQTVNGVELVKRSAVVQRHPGHGSGTVLVESRDEDHKADAATASSPPCYCSHCVGQRFDEVAGEVFYEFFRDGNAPDEADYERFEEKMRELVRLAAEAGPRPELAFFNRLSGALLIELAEPPRLLKHLPPVERANAMVGIKSLRLEIGVLENEGVRALTAAEYASVAFDEASIGLRGQSGEVVSHAAPNGRHFTVRDLLAAVERTELMTRGNTEWLDGIDIHHTFFEGLTSVDDGTWSICWGS